MWLTHLFEYSCFSLGMIAEFEDTILGSGPCAYRRLFWEAGLIGQVLYLEGGLSLSCYTLTAH